MQEYQLFTDRIQHIREKLVRLNEMRYPVKGRFMRWISSSKPPLFVLNPPAEESLVEKFERHHGIRLPEDYRQFIIELGDGGWGPCCDILNFCGLVSRDLFRGVTAQPWLARPFPLIQGIQSFDAMAQDYFKDYPPVDGSLLIGRWATDEDVYVRLVLSGAERGNIWCDAMSELNFRFGPCGDAATGAARIDFTTWYDRGLDAQLAYRGVGPLQVALYPPPLAVGL